MTDLLGSFRPLQRHAAGLSSPLRQDEYTNLTVSSSLPSLFDLARHGRIFAANTGAGTGKAPVADLPTTTAVWGLYNGYSNNTHLVVLHMTCDSVSGTLGLGMGLLGCLCPLPQASAVTSYSNSVLQPVGRAESTSKAVFGNNITLATAPAWITLASGDQLESISVGSGLVAKVDGLFLVPPGHVCGLNVLAPTGTGALFSAGFVWAELPLGAL